MRRLTCVMFVGALVLSGCGGEDPPPPAPTSVATTPANPDATLPAMPAGATEDSHGGASTFVRYYLLVLNFAALTGDTSQLEALSSADCTSCRTYMDLFKETYAGGGFFTGGEWSFDESEVRYTSATQASYVTADVRTAEGTQKLSSDEDESATSAKTTLLTFELTSGHPRQIAEISQGGFE